MENLRGAGWLGERFRRSFGRLSHRTRIALAFVVLVVTSASCTILIGNAVFGRKADELARARLTLDLDVVKQAAFARTRFPLSLVAPPAGETAPDAEAVASRLCGSSAADLPFDFLSVLDLEGRRASVFHRHGCAARPIEGKALEALLASDLGVLAGSPGAESGVGTGFVVLRAPELGALGEPESGGRADLGFVAAARLGAGLVLVVGSRAATLKELLAGTLERLAGRADVRYRASIFLGEERVATTLGEGALRSRAAPEVLKAVLGKGESFAGRTDVAGLSMNAAYEPLRDFRGKVAGMLEISTHEDVYGEIRRRTATLFTTIIAGGMTFGFLMAWAFSVTLTRPLKDLARGIERVARGDLDLKVRIDSSDELGQLAKAFNVMVQAVKERDIRLHEMTQEKLSQVEKQVSVGRLAAGVAHEINNPLTAILSLSMMLRKSLPDGDPRRDDLDIVVTETTRCRDIVTSLLDFARERPAAKRVVDVNQVMQDTLALTARYDALAQVKVEVRLSPASLLVNADAKQIQQVFTNVILNAAEATKPGGTITIATDDDSSGGFAVVKVQDTGKGIPEECLNRVFEPFFTTKGTGKGTGLGLSVSLGIIQKHDGAIDLESAEGRGTTVTITLPRAKGE